MVAVAAMPIPVTKLEEKLHPAELVLQFHRSAAPLDLCGKLVRTGIRMEPSADGVWHWDGDRRLVFKPANDWPAGQKYRITLDKSIIAPHVLLDRYMVEASTAPFAAKFNKVQFYQNPLNPAVKQVVATLEFSHGITAGELEKHLTMAMLGGSPVFKSSAPAFFVKLGSHDRIAYVTSAGITLPEREDFMKLELDRKMPAARGGATLKEGIDGKVRIPDVFSFFKIDGVEGKTVRNKDGEPEQMLFVRTSAETKTDEIAKNLEVFLLPKKADKTAKEDTDTGTETDNHGKNDADDADDETEADEAPACQWKSPHEVDGDVLAMATPVKFAAVPSGEENSKQHIFKINVEADGDLYARIRKGTRALGDFQLGADYAAVLPVPQPEREVEIQGDGGVLALNGERKLSIKSRGLQVIEYEIARVPADQINHLVSQTEGAFQNPEFVNSHFDETNIARVATERQAINMVNRHKANFSTFDFSSHLGQATDGGSPMQGLFFLKARGWDPKKKKYINAEADRFILVTDTGMLVKQNADGSRDVFLQSLRTREPLGGVEVDILARNGVPAVSGATGADGHVAFPALGKPAREKEPVAFVARNGSDVAFMPFARDDRKLDFSRFDVDGITSVTGAELDAFAFTERGVYRPGDEIHVAFSVKQHNWGGDLTGLPIETEVKDARGLSAQVKKMALPAGGMAEFSYQTAYESPTGDYTFNVYLVRKGRRDALLGSTGALVKEFLPDRLKINSHLSVTSPGGWISPKEVKAFVSLRNLYGTPASNRRVVGRMELYPARFQFEEYRGYTFFDRLLEKKRNQRGETVELGETKTSDDGTTEFDLDLERYADATYAMNFYAEGFEAGGGRSVNTDCAALVSSLPYVVGSKTDGNFNYLKMNSDHAVEFIAIDHALKKIAVDQLQLDVIAETYVSVLKKQEDGTYAYESVKKEVTVHTEDTGIPAAGWKYTLPTGTPGNYILALREKEGGTVVSRCAFSVVGLGEVSRSLDKNAELNVKLGRDEYNAGDNIEVSITAPYTGSGLITIERDKVYAYQWFKADQTGSVQHIRLPEGFDGTGYVNVSFIRALDSKEIFMSPLSYGVVPFTANREKRTLKIELNAAKEARPGEPFKISYKTDRPAKIVVYAVDQGILQVTGYELPDPLGYYFRKYALMVGTSQILDLVLPEYSMLRSAAFGGDGEARHLNPFKRVTEKPVVYWSGVIDADSQSREVVYQVPDYFSGTLTVMAVAVAPDAVNSAHQDSLIRGPFVITPGVPTLAAPGDVFETGVTVANNAAGSGTNAEVTLTAEVSEHLEIVKSPQQPLHVPEGQEASAVFTLRVKEKLGSASVTFKAAAHGQESRLRSTLSIRPATPLMTDVRSGNFTKETVTVPVTREMLPEYRNLDAVVSSTPLGLAHGLDVYLKNYPNGCSEQLTSGAFCRLMLSDEADFALPRTEIFAQLEKTFDVLRRRQNDQGAFGYWAPENNNGINFVPVYVMHFLIEAKDSGFVPPADVFQSGLRFLQKMVVQEPRNLEEARTVAYAIYLLTREEVVTTNYILNLRDYLDKHYEKHWEGDLTGVYLAGSLSMLGKDSEAEKLIAAYKLGIHAEHERCDFYQPLGEDSQYVAVVARHFPGLLRTMTAEDFQAVTGPVGEGDFNTLSAAYAVLALKSYARQVAGNPPALSIREITKDRHETELQADGKLLKRAEFSADTAELRFGAAPAIKGMGAFYQVIETGFDAHLPNKPVTDGLEVYREFIDRHGKPVIVTKLGEPVTVRVEIRSLKQDSITNVAIVDLLPGGFEIAGDSLKPGTRSAGCDYVDVREDRAVFFTSAGTGVKQITYQIKACNRGEFTVPPVFAESMYDRSVKARGVPGKITVVDAQ
jgi:hypothetical protein